MSECVLLTVKEYAQMFRKHPDSVYRRIRQKTLRYELERDGRNILIMVPSSIVSRLTRATRTETK